MILQLGIIRSDTNPILNVKEKYDSSLNQFYSTHLEKK